MPNGKSAIPQEHVRHEEWPSNFVLRLINEDLRQGATENVCTHHHALADDGLSRLHPVCNQRPLDRRHRPLRRVVRIHDEF